ncbi:MAG: nucleoside transporter C-terminal domain-containing protein [Geobacteraceae bacterium]|nr:nucleoside transporter C-terminal domain-containing protein [Geobacteraceae bacterium]
MDIYNLISFCGIFFLLGFAWLLSADRRRVNWRLLSWGVGMQMVFASFIFLFPAGTRLFLAANDAIVAVLDAASAGSRFLFGRLALPPGATGGGGETSLGFILAFQAFPTIVFFSALMAILYYYGIMQRIIRVFARLFSRCMGVSGAESLVAASNIFTGVESALAVRPFLSAMTRSELCTILTVGMATVSSNVMALYVFTLKPQFPTIAGHLMSASILSAPAALVLSKILVPETGQPVTLGITVIPEVERESSLFEAIINAANAGIRVIVGISGLLLAVLGLVALADMALSGAGGYVNALLGTTVSWSFRDLLGLIFYPFTLALGIPLEDAGLVARIIGERVVLTEVVSYQDLSAALAAKQLFHPRSAVIAAYALCGFAHVASMAIFVGGVSALAPDRTRDLSNVALRALVASTLACLVTGCVAGVFYSGNSLLF